MDFDFAFHLCTVFRCIDICSTFLFSSDNTFASDCRHGMVAAGKYRGIAGRHFGCQFGGFAHRQGEVGLVQGNLRRCHGDGADLGDAVQFHFDVGGTVFYCPNRAIFADSGNGTLTALKCRDKPGRGFDSQFEILAAVQGFRTASQCDVWFFDGDWTSDFCAVTGYGDSCFSWFPGGDGAGGRDLSDA